MRTEIIQYKRDKNNNPIGVVVAILNESNSFKIGWSKAAEGDHFTKERGLQIARGRALKGTKAKLPADMKRLFEDVNVRAGKEFKISI